MVVWCSRPWHPLENKNLGSFVSWSCNNGKKKGMMHVQSGCFGNLTLLLFCLSCCCPYMYVWIHGYHGNKKALNLKLILLATMLL